MYCAFVDEVGDRGYPSTNPKLPYFCLICCLVEEGAYKQQVIPEIRTLKRDSRIPEHHWLHRVDVRTAKGPFAALRGKGQLDEFVRQMSSLVTTLPIKLFGSVVDKETLHASYKQNTLPAGLRNDPLHLSLTFLVERLVLSMRQGSQDPVQITCESRGRSEDEREQTLFDRLLRYGTEYYTGWEFEQVLKRRLCFVAKRGPKAASPEPGLEIADWVGLPFVNAMRGDTSSAEWIGYKSLIWVGRDPEAPGQTGLKTFPQDTHRELLGISIRTRY